MQGDIWAGLNTRNRNPNLEICQPNKDEWKEAEKRKKMIRNYVDRKIDSKIHSKRTQRDDPAGS